MFILVFFLAVSLIQFINNKTLGISDDSKELTEFSKKDSLIIAGLFLTSVILQVLSSFSFFDIIFWWVILTYLITSVVLLVIAQQIRKEDIISKREDMQQVYDILQKLVDKKGNGIDFNNPPFELKYKRSEVQRILIPVDPVTLADVKDLTSAMVPYISQLDNFFPEFKWTFEKHFEQRYIEFVGEEKPPKLARWAGGWLRPAKFLPMGLSGKGEIGFTTDSFDKENTGRSLYLTENGDNPPLDDSLPIQPQALCCGAPLSLDTLIPTTSGYKTMLNVEIGDYVFNRMGEPVNVIAKSKIRMADKMYELSFQYKEKIVKVKADEIHMFPKMNGSYITHTKTKKLKKGDKIVGTKNSLWELIDKKEIRKEMVKCILVNDSEHIFVFGKGLEFDDKQLYSVACCTTNTGGGKSVYIEQEVYN